MCIIILAFIQFLAGGGEFSACMVLNACSPRGLGACPQDLIFAAQILNLVGLAVSQYLCLKRIQIPYMYLYCAIYPFIQFLAGGGRILNFLHALDVC